MHGLTSLTHLVSTEYQLCARHYCIFWGHSKDKTDQIPTLLGLTY